jgi:hypothetical protein
MGVVDPIFLHELALELGMTVQELTTGVPGATAFELSVAWPEFFAYRAREAKRQEDQAKANRKSRGR